MKQHWKLEGGITKHDRSEKMNYKGKGKYNTRRQHVRGKCERSNEAKDKKYLCKKSIRIQDEENIRRG